MSAGDASLRRVGSWALSRIVANPADAGELSLVGDALAGDVERSIREALAAGANFLSGSDPLSIFRNALAESIRDIEHHESGQLLQRFLLNGPYEDVGDIPPDKVSRHLSDDETASAIAFIFSFMVNAFKGALMELLACAPCLRLMSDLREQGHLSDRTRLHVGDSVLAAHSGTSRFGKGADLHVLAVERSDRGIDQVTVAGVVEVKSYPLSQRRLREQLNRHLRRASLGLRIGKEEIDRERIRTGRGQHGRPTRIGVVPSSWKLPRTIEIEVIEGRKLLRVEAPEPRAEDRVVRTAEDEWRITLRWSQEAIASAAYEMTFWYMEKAGEVIYRGGVPTEWSEMTPAKAGRNAVKMMLYYAILRARTAKEEERAIALYNAYGFGYALGMSFRRSRKGRREMLWLQDLDEIAERGETKKGFKLW